MHLLALLLLPLTLAAPTCLPSSSPSSSSPPTPPALIPNTPTNLDATGLIPTTAFTRTPLACLTGAGLQPPHTGLALASDLRRTHPNGNCTQLVDTAGMTGAYPACTQYGADPLTILRVCGQKDAGVPCEDVAMAAERIVEGCGYAGGQVKMEGEGVMVYLGPVQKGVLG